jgi:hypothetical protein
LAFSLRAGVVAPLAVLTKGAQEISRAWFDVMQDRLAKNIGAMNRLASCRSLQHFLAVQSSAGVDACVRDFHQRVNIARRSGVNVPRRLTI